MREQSRVTSRCDVAHSGRENLHQILPILLWRHALSSSIMALWKQLTTNTYLSIYLYAYKVWSSCLLDCLVAWFLDWLRSCVHSIIHGFSRPVMKVSNLDTIECIFNLIYSVFIYLFYLFCTVVVSWIRNNNSSCTKNVVIKKALT